MPARLSLATRTIFNLLGPLANPAGASRQVVGVFSPAVLGLAGEALRGLGTEHAYVVHSEDGMDEISICAATQMAEVRPAGWLQRRITPEDFGFTRAGRAVLEGGDTKENAAILTRIFDGEKSARRDMVLMNAAVALTAAGVASDFRDGVARGAAAIDTGRVGELVEALRREGS